MMCKMSARLSPLDPRPTRHDASIIHSAAAAPPPLVSLSPSFPLLPSRVRTSCTRMLAVRLRACVRACVSARVYECVNQSVCRGLASEGEGGREVQ